MGETQLSNDYGSLSSQDKSRYKVDSKQIVPFLKAFQFSRALVWHFGTLLPTDELSAKLFFFPQNEAWKIRFLICQQYWYLGGIKKKKKREQGIILNQAENSASEI